MKILRGLLVSALVLAAATSHAAKAEKDDLLAAPKLEAAAKETLRKLADAYSAKRRSAFMRLVSEDFAGDLSTLEDALAKDFRDYRSVNLDLRPDKVEVQGLSASVSFRYNLAVVSDQGANKTFRGRSSYVFHREDDGKVRLYKMEKPILFGNSLPSPENPVAAGQKSMSAAESTAPGRQDTIRGSASIADVCGAPGVAFKFETQSSSTFGAGGPDPSADIYRSGGNIAANTASAVVSIGDCELEAVTSAPGTITGRSAPANVGECYAVRTVNGKYAVLRVTSMALAFSGCSLSFDYRFQPSGSTSFQ